MAVESRLAQIFRRQGLHFPIYPPRFFYVLLDTHMTWVTGRISSSYGRGYVDLFLTGGSVWMGLDSTTDVETTPLFPVSFPAWFPVSFSLSLLVGLRSTMEVWPESPCPLSSCDVFVLSKIESFLFTAKVVRTHKMKVPTEARGQQADGYKG